MTGKECVNWSDPSAFLALFSHFQCDPRSVCRVVCGSLERSMSDGGPDAELSRAPSQHRIRAGGLSRAGGHAPYAAALLAYASAGDAMEI